MESGGQIRLKLRECPRSDAAPTAPGRPSDHLAEILSPIYAAQTCKAKKEREMIGGVSQRIDGGRLWQRLMDFAKYGATSKGGVCRLALSMEEVQARAELVAWAKSIGLKPSVDATANLFLALEGLEPQLPPLLIGSHIDSPP